MRRDGDRRALEGHGGRPAQSLHPTEVLKIALRLSA
jgi:hypothetical protein